MFRIWGFVLRRFPRLSCLVIGAGKAIEAFDSSQQLFRLAWMVLKRILPDTVIGERTQRQHHRSGHQHRPLQAPFLEGTGLSAVGAAHGWVSVVSAAFSWASIREQGVVSAQIPTNSVFQVRGP